MDTAESEDLYLLNCKIHLVGFDASEMHRLINMVRTGSGSHYISLNEELTHIVVGTPSEIEKEQVRTISAMGVVNVVKTIWLEDCEREKKKLPVLRRHAAYDLLFPKGLKQGNPTLTVQLLPLPNDQSQRYTVSGLKSSVFRGRSFGSSSTFPDVRIPSMEHTAVKEAIQAQSQLASSVQSAAGKEPIQAQSQSRSLVQSTGRLKRNKAPAYEKGRKTLICNYCHSVIRVRGENKNATSKVFFTIPEEEEIPLRNVKARTVKDCDNTKSHEAELLAEGLFAHIYEDDLTPMEKGLLGNAKEELKEIFYFLSTYSGSKNK